MRPNWTSWWSTARCGRWSSTGRSVSRLRLDFDLDLFTVALLIGYLNRIEALERQVQSLQAQLPGHERYAGEGADP